MSKKPEKLPDGVEKKPAPKDPPVHPDGGGTGNPPPPPGGGGGQH